MVMGHCIMLMIVITAVIAMNMDMGVGVRMLMGVDDISMAMSMGMGMAMLMGVLQFDGVLDHKIRADNHYYQGSIELYCRSFAQNQHTECNT